MKSKTTPAPRRAGTTKREHAEAFASKVLEALGNDREALDLIARTVRMLSPRRVRLPRRN